MAPKNIILHHLTNDVNSEKTPCQIPRLIIDLTVLLETNTNNIAISLYMTLLYPHYPITPHNNDLNNKASEVNNLLVYMCGERHIPVIRHSQTIHPDTLLVKKGSIQINMEQQLLLKLFAGICQSSKVNLSIIS